MAVVAWDCADEEYRERAYKAMAVEIDQLKHDLDRHIQIAADLATELKALKANGR